MAGGALNFARGLVPENQRVARKFMHSPELRTGIGGMTPTTFATGYLYAGMGWTTVNEAAVPILSAKHTHEEMHDIPIVDKSTLAADGEQRDDAGSARGGRVRAGEVTSSDGCSGPPRPTASRRSTPAASPRGSGERTRACFTSRSKATRASRRRRSSRSSRRSSTSSGCRIRCISTRTTSACPGNVTSTIETMKVLQGHRAHLAHLQFHAYGGHDWGSMKSEAPAIAEEFNKNKNLTCDVGAVLFGDAVTITADGPWQHLLYELTGRKWGNLDVENETGCGIVPYVYSDHHLVNAVQWAVGLELLLLIDDPWRVYLTTDHPNGGGFWRYPEILRLLMDVEFRKGEVRKLPAEAQKRITLGDIDRQYTFSDVAILTSAGPARALGLTQKGHLGVGADGDITIYPEKPNEEGVLFSYPRYVLKGGRSSSRRDRCARSARAASSSCIPTSTRRSRSSSARCSRRSTRCRSKTTRRRSTGSITRNRAVHPPVRSAPTGGPVGARMITLTLKEPVDSVPLEAEALCRTRWPRSRTTRSARCRSIWERSSAGSTTSSPSRARPSDELEIRGDVEEGPVDRPRHDAAAASTSSATPACISAPT